MNNENSTEFYNLKTRMNVTIPHTDCTKVVTRRTLKSGKEQDRYALKATTPEGTKLAKMISKATYDSLVDVKEG